MTRHEQRKCLELWNSQGNTGDPTDADWKRLLLARKALQRAPGPAKKKEWNIVPLDLGCKPGQQNKRVEGESVRVFRNKNYVCSHMFLSYAAQVKTPAFKVTYKQYSKICDSFNAALAKSILEGAEHRLPFGMGGLGIRKRKMNHGVHGIFPKIDFNATRIAGVRVFHLNEHSDEWWARWHWTKRRLRHPTCAYYCFRPSRANRAMLAERMRKPGYWKRYRQ